MENGINRLKAGQRNVSLTGLHHLHADVRIVHVACVAVVVRQAVVYISRLTAISMQVTIMNIIMPTLPHTVLARVPRGSSSGAV